MIKKKLVVIGGGAAGHKIAYLLQEVLDVTLIDPKNYFEVPMAIPRLIVEPNALPAQISFREFLLHTKQVQGKAVSITREFVRVETRSKIEAIYYDILVIATGSSYFDPLVRAVSESKTERREQIQQTNFRLHSSKSVAIVGGGAVGVEIAAELRESFPSLPVTLLHSGDKLLETAPSKFGDWALDRLRRMGCRVLLNDPVKHPTIGTQPANGEVTTKSGKVLNVDFIIWAVGAKPNTTFVATSFPEVVQDDGFLNTDEYLRLHGFNNIFVAGDITNLPEANLAIIAARHVSSIVGNIKSMISGSEGDQNALKPYKPLDPHRGIGKLMIVTLGRQGGLTSLPFGQFKTNFLARTIKAKTMFVDKYRRDIALPSS